MQSLWLFLPRSAFEFVCIVSVLVLLTVYFCFQIHTVGNVLLSVDNVYVSSAPLCSHKARAKVQCHSASRISESKCVLVLSRIICSALLFAPLVAVIGNSCFDALKTTGCTYILIYCAHVVRMKGDVLDSGCPLV